MFEVLLHLGTLASVCVVYWTDITDIVKECVVIGAGSKVEIWAKDVWEQYISLSQEGFEELAESLTEFML